LRLSREFRESFSGCGEFSCVIDEATSSSHSARPSNLHEQLLELAARREANRRAVFAAVNSRAELGELQTSLRAKFLDRIGGLPDKSGPPSIKKTGEILADGCSVEKLVFETFPGYFISALL
jgi:hypothetical protein